VTAHHADVGTAPPCPNCGFLTTVLTCLALTVTMIWAVTAQSSPEPVLITSAVVSSVVFATWGADAEPGGEGRLTFLVLARGSSGWILPNRSEDTSFSISSSVEPTRPPNQPTVIEQYVTVGSTSYNIKVDRRANTVSVGSLTTSLQGVNAVLVDGIDSRDGPHFAQRLWVDPKMVNPVSIGTLIRANPDLRYFLRCDLSVDDPIKQQVADMLCAGR